MSSTRAKHTPGPWEVTETDIIYHSEDKLVIGPAPSFYDIARVKGYVGPNSDGHANARLIASSPRLIETLKLAVDQVVYLYGRLSDKERRFTSPTTEGFLKAARETIKAAGCDDET